MTDQEEKTEAVEPREISALYEQDKAFVDTQIATAKTYPRNITRATDDALELVTMDEETAATCTYTVPRGGKKISGPSVHLAKILAQVWGNMRVEARVIEVGKKTVTSQGIAFDLQSNLAIKVEVKRSIWGKYGRFSDDMITVTGNAANAVALRNAILNVVPRSVVNKVYNAALNTITGDISDEQKFKAARGAVVKRLKDTYEVTEKEILGSIGKVSLAHIVKDDLVALIGIGQAIKDGDTTVDEAFRDKKPEKAEIDEKELKELYEKHKKSLPTEEQINAERVIDKKEKNSYKKLFKLLQDKENADNKK